MENRSGAQCARIECEKDNVLGIDLIYGDTNGFQINVKFEAVSKDKPYIHI